MKLDYCTLIQLKNERLKAIQKLVRLADKVGRTDAILIDRNYNQQEMEESEPEILQVSSGY